MECVIDTKGLRLASTRQPSWFGLALGNRSDCRGRGSSRGARAALPPDTADVAVTRLRGGDASSPNGSKGDAKEVAKDDASWGLNLNVFGWGADSEAEAEAKAEKKRKAKQDMEDAEAREEMRKAREERCAGGAYR